MAFIKRSVQNENVIIDLDAKKTSAKIIRGGVEYTAPGTSPEAVVAFVDALGKFTTFEEPRVMRQVPAPGTLVAPGTVVSLTLVPPSDTPFDVFTGVHAGLREDNVATLVNILTQDQKVAAIVAGNDTADEVSLENQVTLATAAGVDIDEASPDTSFKAVFDSYKIAAVYK